MSEVRREVGWEGGRKGGEEEGIEEGAKEVGGGRDKTYTPRERVSKGGRKEGKKRICTLME